MAYSFIRYTGDGIADTFAIPFPYLSELNINVFVDGVEVPFTISESNVVLESPPAAGTNVVVRRLTSPGSSLVDWSNLTLLRAADMNQSTTQLFYRTQENWDKARDVEERGLLFPPQSVHRNLYLPTTLVADKLLGVNAAADAFELKDIPGVDFTQQDTEDYTDAAVAGLASDLAEALVEGVWHDATGWIRNSANDATDANFVQLTNFLLPGGLMGANDALEIISTWTFVGANNKNTRIKFGVDNLGGINPDAGTAYLDNIPTTQLAAQYYTLISNRAATNSQVGYYAGAATSFTTNVSPAAPVTSAIDTTVDQYISFQCKWAGAQAAHSIKLERYIARLIRP